MQIEKTNIESKLMFLVAISHLFSNLSCSERSTLPTLSNTKKYEKTRTSQGVT